MRPPAAPGRLAQTSPPRAVSSAGLLPVLTVSTTARASGSRRRTAPAASATHSEPPATLRRDRLAAGRRSSSVTRSVAGSIRETVPSWRLATHTAPSPTATALGPLPTPICSSGSFERGSIGTTTFDVLGGTHTASAPAAMAIG